MQARVRYLHYSPRTEEAYLYWIRFFIRWSGMRHPREMGADEVRQFLTLLAVKRNVSVSTHRVALSGLLFLYQKVLCVDLPWLDGFEHSLVPRRLPKVLTREEVARIVALLSGDHAVSRVCSTGQACASGRGSAQNYGLKNHDDLLPCTESRGARRDQSAGPDLEQR